MIDKPADLRGGFFVFLGVFLFELTPTFGSSAKRTRFFSPLLLRRRQESGWGTRGE